MRRLTAPLLIVLSMFTLSACSVFGGTSVKIAPYEVIETEGAIEIRHYDHLVLASTQMPDGMDSSYGPFYKLFNYISGKNDKTEKIAMTAPVFMEQVGQPSEAMSFVLPADLSLETAPLPSDTAVKLTELSDYRVAIIRFSGFLDEDSIATQQALLQSWIADRGLTVVGAVKAAGYNPPFTLPFLRRNEIVIPIKKF